MHQDVRDPLIGRSKQHAQRRDHQGPAQDHGGDLEASQAAALQAAAKQAQ